MKRGDIVIVAPPSPFNKPRPAIVIQQSLFTEQETVTVALITSDLSFTTGFRVPVQPTASNGLRKPSEIMIDNIQTVLADRIGGTTGEASAEIMHGVDASLRLFLGLP